MTNLTPTLNDFDAWLNSTDKQEMQHGLQAFTDEHKYTGDNPLWKLPSELEAMQPYTLDQWTKIRRHWIVACKMGLTLKEYCTRFNITKWTECFDISLMQSDEIQETIYDYQ